MADILPTFLNSFSSFCFFRANGGQDQDEFRNNLNDMFESMGQVLSLTGDNTVDMQVSVYTIY